jgi:hypothetical protein
MESLPEIFSWILLGVGMAGFLVFRHVFPPRNDLDAAKPDEPEERPSHKAWAEECLRCEDWAKAREKRISRASWPVCPHCDQPIPRFDPSLIFTWKCPHCGANPRHKSAKSKTLAKHAVEDGKQPSLDPDF